MKALWSLAVGIALIVSVSSAQGYELATHARLSYEGYLKSQLNQNHAKRGSLALPEGSYTNLGLAFYDNAQDGRTYVRAAARYDWDQHKFPVGWGPEGEISEELLRVIPPGWLMRGAVREDDISKATAYLGYFRDVQPPPFDDPYGNFDRVCNHFFDPLNNAPFNGLGGKLCGDDLMANAPQWALGSVGSPIWPNSYRPDAARRNHFTVLDAREAMWRALTLTRLESGTMVPIANNGPEVREIERKAYWATTFFALGSVVHTLQDMAQPQHTRNEIHASKEQGLYEAYINRRAIGFSELKADLTIDGETIFRANNLPLLDYEGYPVPHFQRLSDFWSTSTGSSIYTGRGLAEYSNRGFLTPAAGIWNNKYPWPSRDPDNYTIALDTTSAGEQREYLHGKVSDTYRGSSDYIHMARRGLFYDALSSSLGSEIGTSATSWLYSMDRKVFDEHAKLLIPRAVAYTAGAIDYFFRGTMEIAVTDLNAYAIVDHSLFGPKGPHFPIDVENGKKGFNALRLMLKNTTPPQELANGALIDQDMSDGKLVAVVKFHRNLCYKSDLTGELTDLQQWETCRSKVEETVVSEFATNEAGVEVTKVPFETEGDPRGARLVFRFSENEIPINAWDVLLQVVYRGRLGAEEDAVVVTTQDISEPTYVQLVDSADCDPELPADQTCTSTLDDMPVTGSSSFEDLYIVPRFPMDWQVYGIVVSLGRPSEPTPQRLEQAFPGRIVRVAGLYPVDAMISVNVYQHHYPPHSYGHSSETAVIMQPHRVQSAVDGVATEQIDVWTEKFRGIPVASIQDVVSWGWSTMTLEMNAERPIPVFRYASPIKLLTCEPSQHFQCQEYR